MPVMHAQMIQLMMRMVMEFVAMWITVRLFLTKVRQTQMVILMVMPVITVQMLQMKIS